MSKNPTEPKTAIQISKRVHRKVRLACLHDGERNIGATTDQIMERWADNTAKRLGFEFDYILEKEVNDE